MHEATRKSGAAEELENSNSISYKENKCMHSKNNSLNQAKLYAYVSIAQAEVALRSKVNGSEDVNLFKRRVVPLACNAKM